MKTLLVGFSGDNGHWGCYGTSYALLEHLLKDGPVEKLDSIEGRQYFKYITIFDCKAYGRSKTFVKNHPETTRALEACDRVVVNGEGTLHSRNTSNTKYLLGTISAAQIRQKPVFLMNHSLFPNDFTEDPTIDQVYVEILRELDGIATRESASHAFYSRYGIEAQEAFDCLPLYISENFSHLCQAGHGLSDKKGAYVIVTNGVNSSISDFRKLLDMTIDIYGGGRRIVYLCGSMSWDNQEEDQFVSFIKNEYKRRSSVDICVAKSFSEFLLCIRDAHLLVTGRFHYSLAAVSMDTPFIAIGSNTPKTSAALADAGYDSLVFDPKPINIKQIAKAIGEFEAGKKALKTELGLDDLAARALKNFDILRLPARHSPDSRLLEELGPEVTCEPKKTWKLPRSIGMLLSYCILGKKQRHHFREKHLQ